MNILFLTISRIQDIDSRDIYTDLIRKFRNEGHLVYVVTPYERQFGLQTALTESKGVYILGVRTLNLRRQILLKRA